MARITAGILPDSQNLYLTLDRWQELMRICPSAFNGLERTDGVECCDCDAIWKQSDRDALAMALAQAEEMRERELGYHLAPKYVVGEEHDYERPIVLNKKHLISIGSEACVDIALSVPITLSAMGVINDPVIVAVATTVTDTSEIKVYYPGEDVEIKPSKITIAAGVATIEIMRARLMTWEASNSNCDPAPRYDDDANFITEIDIKRCYLDKSDGAFSIWVGGNCCANCDFTELTQQLYTRIEDNRIATYTWKFGTYDVLTDTWSVATPQHACRPSKIKTSYLSGRRSSVSTEIETIRLAHTLLSTIIPDRLNLCSGCWKEDMTDSKVMTPYGIKQGAYSAWMSDSRAKVGFGYKIPRMR